ncbi:hypothetical protein OIU77_023946 [Salix suchowensis]|uniref:Uncharacterized protein n=1 Tax=Salix suchowensis TaxID=1278906 RepID=A0ABQ9C8W9_9ROSI|nr:hypothetical protein OIU77_023946 [Salix suchowensis]
MIPTPNQSSLLVGLSLSKKRVSKKAIKSSFLFRTKMELRACNSGSKLGKESSYSVKISGPILFEEEEEKESIKVVSTYFLFCKALASYDPEYTLAKML